MLRPQHNFILFYFLCICCLVRTACSFRKKQNKTIFCISSSSSGNICKLVHVWLYYIIICTCDYTISENPASLQGDAVLLWPLTTGASVPSLIEKKLPGLCYRFVLNLEAACQQRSHNLRCQTAEPRGSSSATSRYILLLKRSLT